MTNQTFHITGKVINQETQQGVAYLRIEAWDKDLIFDDLVGSTVLIDSEKMSVECYRLNEKNKIDCF